MEEKESTISGSPENTESGSPTPISFVGGGGVISAPPSEPLSASAAAVAAFGGGGKKRGRPRKYDADGNLSPAYTAAVARKAATAATQAAAGGGTPQQQSAGFSLTTTTSSLGTAKSTSSSYEFGSGKRGGRGRVGVGGSGNWQQPFGLSSSLSELFADTAGADFTPHVITVQPGEDVAAKIHGFGHKAPRGICVLSANGTISNVTIRQPGSSGGLRTYEGRFEILSLSGSYIISEAGGVTSKNGGLSITLANPDGRVYGGSVAGWIIAANPIQVVVGSFIPNTGKPQKRKYQRESHAGSMMPTFPDTAEIANTQGMIHYHEAGPPVVSPVPAHSQSEADDSIGSGHNLNVVSSHDHTTEWNNGSEPHRLYPDINISVPGV